MRNPLAILFALLCATLCAQTELAVLAMVGDEVITSQDLHQYVADAIRRQSPAKIEEIRKEALDSLINRELVYLEFKRLKGRLPQEYLQKRINAEINRFANGDQALFEQQLYQQGMTMKEYRDRLGKDLAVQLLIHEKTGKGIYFSEEEIRQYYEAHAKDYSTPRQTRIAVIQLKGDGRYADRIPETVAEILGKLKEGEDFADLARQYSEGANAAGGGDQGWQEALAPILENLVAKMSVGETNPNPVAIGGNQYLVKLLERHQGGIRPLDAAIKEQISNILTVEESNRRYQQFIRELYVRFPVVRMTEE